MAKPLSGVYRDIRDYMTAQKMMKAPTRRAGSRSSLSDSADEEDPLSGDGPFQEGSFSLGRDIDRGTMDRRVGHRSSLNKGLLDKREADKGVTDQGVAGQGVADQGVADRVSVGRRVTPDPKLRRSRIAVVLSATPRKASYTRRTASPTIDRAYRTDGAFLSLETDMVAAKQGSQVRRRGRPKGWKPGMPYSLVSGDQSRARQSRAKAPPPGFAKRRGRPPRAPSPTASEIYRQTQAQFVGYICEWAGCKAELHNLETLRRHIYAVHGRDRRDQPTCRWGKCASAEAARRFGDDEEFSRHVDEKHLESMAWHVGDGPQNSAQDTKALQAKANSIPDYLLDASGKQVTPSVRGQEVEDVATWRMNRKRLKDLRKLRDAMLPDDDESDEGSDADETV